MRYFLLLLLTFVVVLQSCSRANTTTTEDSQQSSSVAVADTSGIPEPVLSRFSTLFPQVKEMTWEIEEGNFEVTFQDNQAEKSVVFSADGTMLVSETAINTNSLPEAMTAYVAQHLNGKKIDQALMVITGTGGITYEIEVEGQDYIFDGEGNFLKIEAPEADEKD